MLKQHMGVGIIGIERQQLLQGAGQRGMLLFGGKLHHLTLRGNGPFFLAQ